MAEVIDGENFKIVLFDERLDWVLYSPSVDVFCSIGERVFTGVLEIETGPFDRALEYISFEEWLRKEIGSKETTIEEATRMIFDEIVRALGDISVRVQMRATTAVHAPVTVEITSWSWRVPNEQQNSENRSPVGRGVHWSAADRRRSGHQTGPGG